MATADPFAAVRRHCLAIPGVTEKLSHGAPSFFAPGTPSRSGPCFVMCMDDHHGDGIVGLWVAAPPGAQGALVAAEPSTYYVPPYVGGRGWVGVRLSEVSSTELVELLDDAYETVRR
jgi:hypothetical protein